MRCDDGVVNLIILNTSVSKTLLTALIAIVQRHFTINFGFFGTTTFIGSVRKGLEFPCLCFLLLHSLPHQPHTYMSSYVLMLTLTLTVMSNESNIRLSTNQLKFSIWSLDVPFNPSIIFINARASSIIGGKHLLRVVEMFASKMELLFEYNSHNTLFHFRNQWKSCIPLPLSLYLSSYTTCA